MKPEEKARQGIDRLLTSAGWSIQDYPKMNLEASLGIAVREFPTSKGEADYLLFVNKKAVGVLEAKSQGTTLSGVAEQTIKYVSGIPRNIPVFQTPIPYAYESTGVETYFRDLKDPYPLSRRLFAFHKPETLKEWLSQKETLRDKLKRLENDHPLITEGLRDCQIEAITNLEKSFAEERPRALIQMATGSGKTYTAVTFIYRLIKFADAKRILFLVDRSNLGRQTLKEFQQYSTPDSNRKFTELYNVQHLGSNTFDPVNRVCITTIQRLYSMLRGEPEFVEDLEERSMFDVDLPDEKPREVVYNPQIPIETFDFIVTDECHRSIYNLWRPVLEYFDAFIIGLTATPSKQTLGFFNQNLVSEYSHERAVADGVNVGYEVYRIKTDITDKGGKVEAGYYVDKRDKLTRRIRWEELDNDFEYTPNQLDRDVVAKDQIRTIIKTFKEKLFTEIFPGRKEIPKTLIFAKDDSHAEDIVGIIREEFGKGNDLCKKITYRTTGEKPEDLIASFRNSYNPRIAVTVDMISTGTDIKPLECIIFMRDVKSRVYFEQMKGRGTRVILPTDLNAVTSDAKCKTHFVIVDAVGVCERIKSDSKPLERKKNVPFETLIRSVAIGIRDEDSLSSLAFRLAMMDRTISDKEREQIKSVAKVTLNQIINELLDSIDPDKQIEKVKEIFNTNTPTEEQIKKATDSLIKKACVPFENPEALETLIEIHNLNEQTIDNVSKDNVIFAGFDEQAKERARTVVDTFKRFIEENKDELTALQIIYNQPYTKRHITYENIKQLAEAIKRSPYNLETESVWKAYEQLESSKVKRAGPQKLLTDVISLIRFTIGRSDILEPFSERVDHQFSLWLSQQENNGQRFTSEQIEWLNMIKDHIATSATVDMEDFEYAPFHEKGGTLRIIKLFGDNLNNIINELNEALVA
jgi:type I restriction enzyme R subunit